MKSNDVDDSSRTSFLGPIFLQHKFTLMVWHIFPELEARLLGKTVATHYYALTQMLLLAIFTEVADGLREKNNSKTSLKVFNL